MIKTILVCGRVICRGTKLKWNDLNEKAKISNYRIGKQKNVTI